MNVVTDIMLRMLGRCPKQFEHRYINGIKRPPRYTSVAIRAAEAGISFDLKHKQETGSPAPGPEVGQVALKEAERIAEEEGVLNDNVLDSAHASACSIAVGLACQHNEVLTEMIDPVEIDEPYEIKVVRLPYALGGVLRCREKGGIVPTYWYRRHIEEGELASNPQIAQSVLADRAINGPIRGGHDASHRSVRVAVPEIGDIIPVDVTARDVSLFVGRAAALMSPIETGLFAPAAPGHPACNKWRCGYWEDVCPYGRRDAKQ